jgi:MoaA/NifB/PqqE/SkfB family radical SAM enzyme
MRFEVISLHFTRKCDQECPFCYRKENDNGSAERDRSFFIEIVPFLSKLTPQVALGGGEPLMDVDFIKKFSKACVENDLICNMTTNGNNIMKMSDSEIKDTFINVVLVSVSLDWYKHPSIIEYDEIIARIKKNSKVIIGTNLLLDDKLLANQGKRLALTVDWLFNKTGVHSVYALYPKGITLREEILNAEQILQALTTVFPHFYVDDLTKNILEQGYEWKEPCHFGKDIISIDEQGNVHGCSFDDNVALHIDEPRDILKLNSLKFEERYECNYLRRF